MVPITTVRGPSLSLARRFFLCNISRGIAGELKPTDNLHSMVFEHDEACLGVGDLALLYQSHSGAEYVALDVW